MIRPRPVAHLWDELEAVRAQVLREDLTPLPPLSPMPPDPRKAPQMVGPSHGRPIGAATLRIPDVVEMMMSGSVSS